mmetsp:Transcript_34758/g.73285  ORF Transcript_34758/g.73285 Transcript_34758/m.73285 type:complete len:217 (+) Transcript_34758:49-699(+)
MVHILTTHSLYCPPAKMQQIDLLCAVHSKVSNNSIYASIQNQNGKTQAIHTRTHTLHPNIYLHPHYIHLLGRQHSRHNDQQPAHHLFQRRNLPQNRKRAYRREHRLHAKYDIRFARRSLPLSSLLEQIRHGSRPHGAVRQQQPNHGGVPSGPQREEGLRPSRGWEGCSRRRQGGGCGDEEPSEVHQGEEPRLCELQRQFGVGFGEFGRSEDVHGPR